MKIVDMSVQMVGSTRRALWLIENAGRTAYQSEMGDTQAFIRKIIRLGHESVLEHASYTFRIVCDRGVSHELARHRIASFTQESTRYCKYGVGITVIRPLGVDLALWETAMLNAERAYLQALEEGWTAQAARHLLPLSLKTEVVMTANVREWRHFIRLRTAPAAHPHMQHIANLIKGQLPAIFVEDL